MKFIGQILIVSETFFIENNLIKEKIIQKGNYEEKIIIWFNYFSNNFIFHR